MMGWGGGEGRGEEDEWECGEGERKEERKGGRKKGGSEGWGGVVQYLYSSPHLPYTPKEHKEAGIHCG